MRYPRFLAGLCLAVLATAAVAAPQPPRFETAARSVRLDGVRLGTELTPTGFRNSLRFTVAYDPADARWHLWTLTANPGVYPTSGFALGDVVHGTSADGYDFTSDGTLSYGPGSALPASFGATVDPPISYLRAAKVGDSWKLLAWHANDSQSPSRWGQYNYNTSISDLGPDPDNRVVTHQGPVSALVTGPGGFHVGAYGLVNDQLYLRVDSVYRPGVDRDGGGIARFAYSDASPPLVEDWSAYGEEAELFRGTPYYWFLDPSPGGGRTAAYAHNAGRVLACGGLLQAFYALRDVNGGLTQNNLWYLESPDDGVNWSAPQALFGDPAFLTLDGAWAPSALFSNPEGVIHGDRLRVYFRWQQPDAPGGSVDYVVGLDSELACDGLFADGFED